MTRDLHEQHRDLLKASAVSEEVAAERGYWTATRKAELEGLGFKRTQCSVPALVIPIRNAAGAIVNYQVRPDQPRIGESGKPVKYESPAGIPPTLDVPPRCQLPLRSAHTALWITEGARKADAAASAGLCGVSLPGVWSWAKRLNGDARQILPDLQRVKFEERKVVVAFDSDAMVKPQVHMALEALAGYLTSQGALVSFAYLPAPEAGVKVGLDDFLAAHTVEDLWGHVEGELREPPEPKESRRPALPTAMLLAAVKKLVRRYVRFPDDHGPTALALYVMHAWAIEAAQVTPYLYVRSAQKRSGKTRLLEALELACPRPLRSASITEAALFQAVEAFVPTLLIDEVDAVFAARSERADALRGVLNAGNQRGAKVLRGSSEGVLMTFNTFCPKVLAGIDTGRLPDTIRDRSIVINLERKKRSEPVERMRVTEIAEQVNDLKSRLEDWAVEHQEELGRYRCEAIPAISDRLEEAFEPLFAIAELAGGDWPQLARHAAVALAKGAEDAGEDHGQLLLEALKDIFRTKSTMFTKDICTRLNDNDELPFGAYRKDQGVDARGLGRLLRPYGIKPKSVRISGDTAKGYARDWFTEVLERYVPAQQVADDPSQASHRHADPTKPAPERDSGVTDSEAPSVTHPSQGKPALQSHNGASCDAVTGVTDEVRPSVRAQTGWTPEAAEEFIERAREAFPGSMELPFEAAAEDETLGAAWDRLERARAGS